MFRLLKLSFLLFVIGGGVYLWTARVPIMERYFSNRLNTKVTIEKIHMGWGSLQIEGLRLANPLPSRLPYAFQEQKITIELSPLELWKRNVQIKQIKVENPTLFIELYNHSGADNNWARLLNNLPIGNQDRKFTVKKLAISNLRFEIGRSNSKNVSIPPIPYLEFNHLGEKDSLTFSQLGRVVFQIILQNIPSKAHVGAILDNVTALPKNVLEGVSSSLSLNEAKGAIQGGMETLQRKTQEASEFLQNLFSFSGN